MKRSIENAARILAVTAAFATGATGIAQAETSSPVSRKEAKAIKLAGKITKELYDTKDYPKGVQVPGILNGSVKIDNAIGNTTSFGNPIILVESHSPAKADTNGKLLNGSWVGIPASDAEGRIDITPVQIQLGRHGGETQSLHLRNKHDTVLEGAGVYATSVTGSPDELIGFDIKGNGNFPSVHIEADGMK